MILDDTRSDLPKCRHLSSTLGGMLGGRPHRVGMITNSVYDTATLGDVTIIVIVAFLRAICLGRLTSNNVSSYVDGYSILLTYVVFMAAAQTRGTRQTLINITEVDECWWVCVYVYTMHDLGYV